MILRRSDVAMRVRMALVDIKTDEDIDYEQSLMISVGEAVARGNATEVAITATKLIAYKNRYKEKSEIKNRVLPTKKVIIKTPLQSLKAMIIQKQKYFRRWLMSQFNTYYHNS